MCRTPIALLLVLSACGHSEKALREARSTSYDADFPTVWNAVTEEIHKRFPEVLVEDPLKGNILTQYIRVQMQDDENKDRGSPQTAPGQVGATQNVPGQTATGMTPFLVFRMTVEVRGVMRKKGPPWRFSVDGEVAEYKPGMAQLIPIKHGQADEPPWVQNRIDSAVMDIHARLRKYAVKREIPKDAIAAKTFDTTPWANLPDPMAVKVVGAVHDAAVARDAAAIRPNMVEDFRWGLGGEGSADTAVALWSADPSKLRDLARALEDGCAADDATGEVVCPKTVSQTASMARFRKVGDGWKFVLFLARQNQN